VNQDLLIDEHTHYDHITRFAKGDFSIGSKLSTIPGYHALMAVIAAAFGISSVAGLRLVSLGIAILSIVIFYVAARHFSPKNAHIKTLQYGFLPILFPYFLLLYTDALSVLFVVLGIWLILKKKYSLAGLSGILSVLVRQNNIVWLAFLLGYAYIEKRGQKDWFLRLREYWVFLLGFIGFIVFVALNRGFAIGDRAMHPAFSLHLGNIWFLGFVVFVLFLPLHIANFRRVIDLARKKRTTIVVIGIFIMYMLTFQVTHPYNTTWSQFFLHNRILMFFTSNLLLKVVFFLPVAYAGLSVAVTRLARGFLLYPITLIYLVPSWLIEHRYYIIPIALFILLKKEERKEVEYSTIAMFALLSLLFVYLIGSLTTFL
jgi:alpha-1,2-glucosyltransferase